MPTNKLPAFSTACPSRNLCTNQAKDDPPLVSEARKDAKFIQDLASSPAPALWLGLAGAIPFTGLAGLSIITPDHMDFILHAQCGYGACILTFLGAIHWGYALCNKSELELDWRTLGYSVTPSLVAWSALLVKPQYGLVTIAIGLLYALSKDLGTVWFPGWYHALRKVLTTIATSSVILTAVTAYIHL